MVLLIRAGTPRLKLRNFLCRKTLFCPEEPDFRWKLEKNNQFFCENCKVPRSTNLVNPVMLVGTKNINMSAENNELQYISFAIQYTTGNKHKKRYF